MKRFAVIDLATLRFLVPRNCRDFDKLKNGGDLEDARIFNSKSAARQAANNWMSGRAFDVVEIDVSLKDGGLIAKPNQTYDLSGIGILKFKDVTDYYRAYYSVNLVGRKSPLYSVDVHLVDYLEANNRFLRGLENGDNVLITEKDFTNADPLLRLIAKNMIDELGANDIHGKFCIFEIDWKGKDGKISSDY